MIRKIGEDEYSREIRKLIISLFEAEKPDIFNFQFNKHFDQSIVLFEYYGIPNKELLQAIMISAKQLGDDGFYLSLPEPHSNSTKYTYHWYVPFEDINDYGEEVTVDALNFIALSPQGLWAILPSYELFAVLSGSKAVINKINELIPEIHMDVERFLLYWQEVKGRRLAEFDVSDVSWVKSLILNTYKRDIAKRLLEEGHW